MNKIMICLAIITGYFMVDIINEMQRDKRVQDQNLQHLQEIVAQQQAVVDTTLKSASAMMRQIGLSPRITINNATVHTEDRQITIIRRP